MSNQSYAEQPQLHTKAPYRSALLTQSANGQEAMRRAFADPAKTLFGVAQGVPSVFVTKLLASTRPDFIWLDAEHETSPWPRRPAVHAPWPGCSAFADSCALGITQPCLTGSVCTST